MIATVIFVVRALVVATCLYTGLHAFGYLPDLREPVILRDEFCINPDSSDPFDDRTPDEQTEV